MILQRLASAIKNRDWSQIITEILIVVIGIFLGLQVTDWNNEREDIAKEQRYLERITVELRSDLEIFNRAIRSADRRIAYGQFLVEAIIDDEQHIKEPKRFIVAINRTGNTFQANISDNTFEEIKSSGDLQIIRDEILRNNISEYYNRRELDSQWEYLREQSQSRYIELSSGVLKIEYQPFLLNFDDVHITIEDATDAYQKIKARQNLIDWIPNVVSMNLMVRSMSSSGLTDAQHLLDAIEDYIE